MIGDKAFYSSSISAVVIPASVLKIGTEAFSRGENLTRVSFESRDDTQVETSELGDGCFSHCRNLVGIEFGRNSPFTRFGRGIIAGCRISEIIVPDSVQDLDPCCFRRCARLTHVYFGSTTLLSSFSEKVFALSGIVELSVPDTIQCIKRRCFRRCSNLTQVRFGPASSLRDIGVEAFTESGITEISIPDTAESIGSRCFYGCRNLARVTIGIHSSLTKVSDQSFESCPALREVNIPDFLKDCREFLCMFPSVLHVSASGRDITSS